MCLITFQWQPDHDNRLILSANRDEFLHRPTQPLHAWLGAEGVYAGKDLSQGGSWLGIHKNGRFAALTNHRDMSNSDPENSDPENPISRGKLVIDFLTSEMSALDYLRGLEKEAALYAGYNLLVADTHQLGYYSNASGQPAEILAPGLYGLSNGLLDSPWPKLKSAKLKLASWLAESAKDPVNLKSTGLCQLLSSTEVAADSALPDTGIGLAMERILSSEKIITPNYGTRCSTGLIMGKSSLMIEETSWLEDGKEGSHVRHYVPNIR
tara:strand:- start:3919 stop:4719 length:801 start_codon:yes stop_codon:yes gene_type:complete